MSLSNLFFIFFFITYSILINSLFEIYNNETTVLINWVNKYKLTKNDDLIVILANMLYINNTYNSKNSWKLKLNKFAALSKENLQNEYKGCKPLYYPNKNTLNIQSNIILKKYIDWRNISYFNIIKNNSNSGFSAIYNLENKIMIKSKKKISFNKSIYNSNGISCYSDSSSKQIYSLYKYLIKYQTTQTNTLENFLYKTINEKCKLINNITSLDTHNFTSINSGDEYAMTYALQKIGPLSAIVHTNLDWQLYDNGIYNPSNTTCSNDISKQDHGVIIIGYGREKNLDYWIIRNSWGADWGENGHMRLVRGKNACGIANSVIYPIM